MEDPFHGLQHAEDLDAGFDQFASSDDHVLAAAASVAEIVVGGFSPSVDDDNMSSPAEPDIGGVSPPPSQSPILLDDRFNQLDELDSQQSQSILENCRPGGAGGEFASSNQICNDSNSSLSNSNDNVCNVGNDSGNVNYYGSEVSPPAPPIVDYEMLHASHPRKQPISETSSDDAPPERPTVPNSKSSTKKSKKGEAIAGHLPGGVASAACLAVSRGSAKK